jgi:uncharacterized caspase-like protein
MFSRLAFVLTILVSACLGQGVLAGAKVALVIGNSAYEAAPFLKNPENDAKLVGAALAEAGFEVTSLTDLGHAALIDALGKFSRLAATSETAVIYYAGHGMEIDRENFLIPVDARLEFATDAEFQAVRLDLMVRSVGGAEKLGIVIVDACRNNPFATRLDQAGRDRGVSQGMGRVEPRGNTLVAYSAREGTVALDGIDDNSPYAVALAAALTTPGLEIGKLFRTVRDSVMDATGGAQEPVLFGTLSAEDYFFIPGDGKVAATPAPQPVATPAEAAVALQLELAFWDAAEKTGSAVEYALYLDRFPDGVFAPLARARLEKFKVVPDGVQVAEATPAPAPVVRGGSGGFGSDGGASGGGSSDSSGGGSGSKFSDRTEVANGPGPRPDAAGGGDSGSDRDPATVQKVKTPAPVVKPPPPPPPPPPVPATPKPAAVEPPVAGKTSLVPVTAPPRDTPADDETPAPLPQGPDLVRAVQSELNRLGCKVGPEDGIWGPASRDGIARMRSVATVLKGVPDEPGAWMLTTLRGLDDAICPPACAPGEIVFNGLCVAGPGCPAGQVMSSKGTCYVPRPAEAKAPVRKSPPVVKSAPPRSGGTCRVFNGKQVC